MSLPRELWVIDVRAMALADAIRFYLDGSGDHDWVDWQAQKVESTTAKLLGTRGRDYDQGSA